jgi:hypothetical protein
MKCNFSEIIFGERRRERSMLSPVLAIEVNLCIQAFLSGLGIVIQAGSCMAEYTV